MTAFDKVRFIILSSYHGAAEHHLTSHLSSPIPALAPATAPLTPHVAARPFGHISRHALIFFVLSYAEGSLAEPFNY